MKKGKGRGRIVIFIFTLYLVLPFLLTAAFSLFESWDGLHPQRFTLEAYQNLFLSNRFLLAMGRTAVISIVPVLISILMTLLVLYAVLVYLPKLEKIVKLLCMLPYAIQGAILSVGIISLYDSTTGPLSNRLILIGGAYCIFVLPFIFQGIRGSMQAINMPMLLDAAVMLGVSKRAGFFKVILPNILSGITAASLLSIAILFRDFVLMRNIAGSEFENVQILLYTAMRSISPKQASAMVTILFLTTTAITAAVLIIQNSHGKGKRKEGVRR